MYAVSTIVGWIDQVRVGATAYDLVEIDYAVERRIRADPFVDSITGLVFDVVPAGVVRGRIAIMPRNNGDADHLYSLCLDAGNDIFQPGDDRSLANS